MDNSYNVILNWADSQAANSEVNSYFDSKTDFEECIDSDNNFKDSSFINSTKDTYYFAFLNNYWLNILIILDGVLVRLILFNIL